VRPSQLRFLNHMWECFKMWIILASRSIGLIGPWSKSRSAQQKRHSLPTRFGDIFIRNYDECLLRMPTAPINGVWDVRAVQAPSLAVRAASGLVRLASARHGFEFSGSECLQLGTNLDLAPIGVKTGRARRHSPHRRPIFFGGNQEGLDLYRPSIFGRNFSPVFAPTLSR